MHFTEKHVSMACYVGNTVVVCSVGGRSLMVSGDTIKACMGFRCNNHQLACWVQLYSWLVMKSCKRLFVVIGYNSVNHTVVVWRRKVMQWVLLKR